MFVSHLHHRELHNGPMNACSLRIAARALLIGVCCLVGTLSISARPSSASEFEKDANKMLPLSTANVPTNDTIRAVWNSGLYRTNAVAGGIYWLDDDTIVVSANKGPKPRTPDEMREEQAWLYLWRLGEKPHPYGADPHIAARSYCAARGEITYEQDIADPKTGTTLRTRLLGRPGSEREVPPWVTMPPGRASNPLTIETTDCKIFSDPAMTGREYVTDSDHRFYLDFGHNSDLATVRAGADEPIVLMHAAGSGRVVLPISTASANSGSTHFHTFDETFYLWRNILGISPIDRFKIWRETNCWPIWKVDPKTTKTERLCIPFGPWSGAAQGQATTWLELAPTKAGLLFSPNAVKANEDPGLFLLSNGNVSRVMPGYILSPRVSPSGCRVAFVYYPNYDAFGTGRYLPNVSSSVVAIDVCSPNSETPNSK